jgi:hypothetical protein
MAIGGGREARINQKNAHLASMELGPEAWAVIEWSPKTGPLFPYLRTVRACDRATEFKQRWGRLGITGVWLHCCRYRWAGCAANTGYPERYATSAVGHSKAVHKAYARKVQGELPSLEIYEAVKRSGKILVLKHESEVTVTGPAEKCAWLPVVGRSDGSPRELSFTLRPWARI